MALAVRTFIADPYKTETRRDVSDSTQKKARFDIRFLVNDLTGVTLDIQSPVPGTAPISLAAGVDFPAVGASLEALARAVLLAIHGATDGLLNLLDPIDLNYLPVAGAGEIGQALYAPSYGAWGEAITIDVNAIATAANIEINGVASAAGYTVNARGASGPRGTSELETFIATLSEPGGLAPSFVAMAKSALASGEVFYTVVHTV